MSAPNLRILMRFSTLLCAVVLFGLLILLSVAQRNPDHLVQFVSTNYRDVAAFLVGCTFILMEEKLLCLAPKRANSKRFFAILFLGAFICFSAVANASTFGTVNFIWQGYFVVILALLVAAVGLVEISESCRS